MDTTSNDDLLTLSEAANLLGMSKSSLRRLIQREKIPVSTLTRHFKVRREDMKRLQDESWQQL